MEEVPLTASSVKTTASPNGALLDTIAPPRQQTGTANTNGTTTTITTSGASSSAAPTSSPSAPLASESPYNAMTLAPTDIASIRNDIVNAIKAAEEEEERKKRESSTGVEGNAVTVATKASQQANTAAATASAAGNATTTVTPSQPQASAVDMPPPFSSSSNLNGRRPSALFGSYPSSAPAAGTTVSTGGAAALPSKASAPSSSAAAKPLEGTAGDVSTAPPPLPPSLPFPFRSHDDIPVGGSRGAVAGPSAAAAPKMDDVKKVIDAAAAVGTPSGNADKNSTNMNAITLSSDPMIEGTKPPSNTDSNENNYFAGATKAVVTKKPFLKRSSPSLTQTSGKAAISSIAAMRALASQKAKDDNDVVTVAIPKSAQRQQDAAAGAGGGAASVPADVAVAIPPSTSQQEVVKSEEGAAVAVALAPTTAQPPAAAAAAPSPIPLASSPAITAAAPVASAVAASTAPPPPTPSSSAAVTNVAAVASSTPINAPLTARGETPKADTFKSLDNSRPPPPLPSVAAAAMGGGSPLPSAPAAAAEKSAVDNVAVSGAIDFGQRRVSGVRRAPSVTASLVSSSSLADAQRSPSAVSSAASSRSPSAMNASPSFGTPTTAAAATVAMGVGREAPQQARRTPSSGVGAGVGVGVGGGASRMPSMPASQQHAYAPPPAARERVPPVNSYASPLAGNIAAPPPLTTTNNAITAADERLAQKHAALTKKSLPSSSSNWVYVANGGFTTSGGDGANNADATPNVSSIAAPSPIPIASSALQYSAISGGAPSPAVSGGGGGGGGGPRPHTNANTNGTTNTIDFSNISIQEERHHVNNTNHTSTSNALYSKAGGGIIAGSGGRDNNTTNANNNNNNTTLSASTMGARGATIAGGGQGGESTTAVQKPAARSAVMIASATTITARQPPSSLPTFPPEPSPLPIVNSMSSASTSSNPLLHGHTNATTHSDGGNAWGGSNDLYDSQFPPPPAVGDTTAVGIGSSHHHHHHQHISALDTSLERMASPSTAAPPRSQQQQQGHDKGDAPSIGNGSSSSRDRYAFYQRVVKEAQHMLQEEALNASIAEEERKERAAKREVVDALLKSLAAEKEVCDTTTVNNKENAPPPKPSITTSSSSAIPIGQQFQQPFYPYNYGCGAGGWSGGLLTMQQLSAFAAQQCTMMNGVPQVPACTSLAQGPGTIDFDTSASHKYAAPTVVRPSHLKHLPSGDPFKHPIGQHIVTSAVGAQQRAAQQYALQCEHARLCSLYQLQLSLEAKQQKEACATAQQKYYVEDCSGQKASIPDDVAAVIVSQQQHPQTIGAMGATASLPAAAVPSHTLAALEAAIQQNYIEQIKCGTMGANGNGISPAVGIAPIAPAYVCAYPSPQGGTLSVGTVVGPFLNSPTVVGGVGFGLGGVSGPPAMVLSPDGVPFVQTLPPAPSPPLPRIAYDDPILLETRDDGGDGTSASAAAAGSVVWWRSRSGANGGSHVGSRSGSAAAASRGARVYGSHNTSVDDHNDAESKSEHASSLRRANSTSALHNDNDHQRHRGAARKDRPLSAAQLAAVDTTGMGIRERMQHKRLVESANASSHAYAGLAPNVINAELEEEKKRALEKEAERGNNAEQLEVIEAARRLLSNVSTNPAAALLGGGGVFTKAAKENKVISAQNSAAEAAVAALMALTSPSVIATSNMTQSPDGKTHHSNNADAQRLAMTCDIVKAATSGGVLSMKAAKEGQAKAGGGGGGVFAPNAIVPKAGVLLEGGSGSSAVPASALNGEPHPLPSSPLKPAPAAAAEATSPSPMPARDPSSSDVSSLPTTTTTSMASTTTTEIISRAVPFKGKPVGVTSLIDKVPPPKTFRDRMRDALAEEEKAFEAYQKRILANQAAAMPPMTDPNTVTAMTMLQASLMQTQTVLDRLRHALINDAPASEIKALMGTAMTIPTSLAATIGNRLSPAAVEAMPNAVKLEYLQLMEEHAQQSAQLEQLHAMWKKALKRERVAEAAANVSHQMMAMPPPFIQSGLGAVPPPFASAQQQQQQGTTPSNIIPSAAYNDVMQQAAHALGVAARPAGNNNAAGGGGGVAATAPPPPPMSIPDGPKGSDSALYKKALAALSPEKGPNPIALEGSTALPTAAGATLFPPVAGSSPSSSSIPPRQPLPVNPAFVAYMTSMLRAEVQKLQGPNEPLTKEQLGWIDQQVAVEVENLRGKQIKEMVEAQQAAAVQQAITAINNHQLYQAAASDFQKQQQQLAVLYHKHPDLLAAALQQQQQGGVGGAAGGSASTVPSGANSIPPAAVPTPAAVGGLLSVGGIDNNFMINSMMPQHLRSNYYPDGADFPVPPSYPGGNLIVLGDPPTEPLSSAGYGIGYPTNMGDAALVCGPYGAQPPQPTYNPFPFYEGAYQHNNTFPLPIPENGGYPLPPASHYNHVGNGMAAAMGGTAAFLPPPHTAAVGSMLSMSNPPPLPQGFNYHNQPLTQRPPQQNTNPPANNNPPPPLPSTPSPAPNTTNATAPPPSSSTRPPDARISQPPPAASPVTEQRAQQPLPARPLTTANADTPIPIPVGPKATPTSTPSTATVVAVTPEMAAAIGTPSPAQATSSSLSSTAAAASSGSGVPASPAPAATATKAVPAARVPLRERSKLMMAAKASAGGGGGGGGAFDDVVVAVKPVRAVSVMNDEVPLKRPKTP